jgi:hypothetical protein
VPTKPPYNYDPEFKIRIEIHSSKIDKLGYDKSFVVSQGSYIVPDLARKIEETKQRILKTIQEIVLSKLSIK